jgi:hypothetical protein
MEYKNIQIVKDCIEQIINAKQFDRIYDYYSEECVFYNPPYVGLGFFPDDSSGERLIVKMIVPNSPAAEVLQQGDVLLRASDAHGTWEGYDDLRTGLWGQGILGTDLSLALLRNGDTIEVTIKRGRIDGFDLSIATLHDVWRHFLLEEMPDLKTEIIQIMATGDLVAYFATNTGTSTIYNQSAVWTECNILRMENGKIVQWWGVEDTLSQWRQLGFQIKEPYKQPA